MAKYDTPQIFGQYINRNQLIAYCYAIAMRIFTDF